MSKADIDDLAHQIARLATKHECAIMTPLAHGVNGWGRLLAFAHGAGWATKFIDFGYARPSFSETKNFERALRRHFSRVQSVVDEATLTNLARQEFVSEKAKIGA